jgi:dolichol-phosphate hexosyltransferase
VKLSILMPVYNERATLASAVKEVLNVNFPCEVELVIVDDGSTDGTRELYAAWAADPRVSVHLHERNQGKGAAIATAAGVATGDYVIMCDADLEYGRPRSRGTCRIWRRVSSWSRLICTGGWGSPSGGSGWRPR